MALESTSLACAWTTPQFPGEEKRPFDSTGTKHVGLTMACLLPKSNLQAVSSRVCGMDSVRHASCRHVERSLGVAVYVPLSLMCTMGPSSTWAPLIASSAAQAADALVILGTDWRYSEGVSDAEYALAACAILVIFAVVGCTVVYFVRPGFVESSWSALRDRVPCVTGALGALLRPLTKQGLMPLGTAAYWALLVLVMVESSSAVTSMGVPRWGSLLLSLCCGECVGVGHPASLPTVCSLTSPVFTSPCYPPPSPTYHHSPPTLSGLERSSYPVPRVITIVNGHSTYWNDVIMLSRPFCGTLTFATHRPLPPAVALVRVTGRSVARSATQALENALTRDVVETVMERAFQHPSLSAHGPPSKAEVTVKERSERRTRLSLTRFEGGSRGGVRKSGVGGRKSGAAKSRIGARESRGGGRLEDGNREDQVSGGRSSLGWAANKTTATRRVHDLRVATDGGGSGEENTMARGGPVEGMEAAHAEMARVAARAVSSTLSGAVFLDVDAWRSAIEEPVLALPYMRECERATVIFTGGQRARARELGEEERVPLAGAGCRLRGVRA